MQVSMASSSSTTSFMDKFCGEGFTSWKLRMIYFLKRDGMWKLVNGEESMRSSATSHTNWNCLRRKWFLQVPRNLREQTHELSHDKRCKYRHYSMRKTNELMLLVHFEIIVESLTILSLFAMEVFLRLVYLLMSFFLFFHKLTESSA